MKIAIVTRFFPSRSETFVTRLAKGLSQRGHSVFVYAIDIGDGISDEEVISDTSGLTVRWVRDARSGRLRKLKSFLAAFRDVWSRPFPLISAIQMLYRLDLPGRLGLGSCMLNLANRQFDIVNVQHGDLARALMCFDQVGLVKGKIIATWHGSDANRYPTKSGIRIYRSLFSQPYVHTVGSEFMAARLTDLGAQKQHIKIIPMGVDLAFFSPPDRQERADHTRPFRIVSVGRLSAEKGFNYLLHAVADLVKQGFSLQLNITGDGPQRQSLEKERLQLGLKEFVRFKGARNQNFVRSQMRHADLFVLPSIIGPDGRVESQGVVLAEAQASGLPVVATKVGGIPESVSEGETAILCEPGSALELSAAIKSLMTDPGRAAQYSAKARKLVECKFDLDEMLNKFEEFYLH